MRVLWAVICQTSVVDQDTNNISLINLMDQINIPFPPTASPEEEATPSIPLAFSLVALFTRTDMEVGESGRARIRIEFPSGTPPDLLPDFDFSLESSLRHRMRFHFSGLRVRGEGIYRFILDESIADGEWRDLYEVPLMLSYQEQ